MRRKNAVVVMATQQISDIANASSNNDVVIGLDLRGQGDESIDAGKQAILGVLQKTFGVQGANSRDRSRTCATKTMAESLRISMT